MPKKQIYFFGLLANTDLSILKVNLEHGFKIKCISKNEGLNLFLIFESLPNMEEVYTKFVIDLPCLNLSEKKFYFISNSFESEIEMNSKVGEFDKLVHDYLKPVIRLMRLFKKGNIFIPLDYYYFIDNDIPRLFLRRSANLYVSSELYTLEYSEISALERFIKDTKLPFTQPFLQLAFENFELSYHTHNMSLSFLLLMICLETLFNRGQSELTYTISRNTAVLLGKDKEDSNNIFREMKELYGKRSRIVHSGKLDIINEDDLSKLRYYVRESIKEIYKMGKDKDGVFDLLNSSGFGDRLWKR